MPKSLRFLAFAISIVFVPGLAFAQLGEFEHDQRSDRVRREIHRDSLIFEPLAPPPEESRSIASERDRWRRIHMLAFYDAVPQFDASLIGMFDAMGDEKQVARYARDMRKQVDALLRYIRMIAPERPTFTPPANIRISNEEITRLVVRVAAELRPRLADIVEAQQGNFLNLHHWRMIYHVERRLLRLRWQTSLID